MNPVGGTRQASRGMSWRDADRSSPDRHGRRGVARPSGSWPGSSRTVRAMLCTAGMDRRVMSRRGEASPGFARQGRHGKSRRGTAKRSESKRGFCASWQARHGVGLRCEADWARRSASRRVESWRVESWQAGHCSVAFRAARQSCRLERFGMAGMARRRRAARGLARLSAARLARLGAALPVMTRFGFARRGFAGTSKRGNAVRDPARLCPAWLAEGSGADIRVRAASDQQSQWES